ncbi:DUF4034 domain-containing protein [Ensifer sp. NM-2]|uniref:DUF4034 domain-containing protein n=1 Tax=Ensifer sp. NM-2 TaxID=2109730 RepID=UPI00352BC85F
MGKEIATVTATPIALIAPHHRDIGCRNAARPDPYHAHLLFGSYCYAQAWRIRTEKLAREISEDRWWAIEMVWSVGSAHLLRALALSARPALAAAKMSNLHGPFGEPAWLTALAAARSQAEQISPN